MLPFALLREIYRQLVKGTGKVVVSQAKSFPHETVRQMKGMGYEAGKQIYCLHDAFLDQFRKKKPRKKSTEPTPAERAVSIDNEIYFDPNITVNVPGMQFPSDYVFLSEKRKKVIDAIERKLSKQIFKTCVRILYFAKKPVYAKFRFWAEAHGFFRHMNDSDFNAWMRGEYSKTSCDYFFAKLRKRIRQNAIIKNAKSRDWYAGDEWNYMSTEEIATLWHFPAQEDLLANVQTAPAATTPPPSHERGRVGYDSGRLVETVEGGVPRNLPVEEYEPYNYP